MKANNTYFLGLGSNLKNREKNLSSAIKHIGNFSKIIKKSFIYETQPVGFKNQNKFLNMAVEIEAKLSPTALLKKLREIERKMGRKRRIKNGPRIIDMDILLCNKGIINLKSLSVPHPRMHKRSFVLKPLSEIAPNLIHPKYKKNIKSLFLSLKNPEQVKIWTQKK